MTDGTTLLRDRLGGMLIVEIRRMVIGGLEIGPSWIMTFGATERWVDLAVAHETIGHLRHVGSRRMV